MTPLVLLDQLKPFIEISIDDLMLPVKIDRNSGEQSKRNADVYLMRLPDKDSETKRIPYVLLQFIKSTDLQNEGEQPTSNAFVRIVAATFSADSGEGAICVLNLLTRIRIALLKAGKIGDQFLLKPPLELIVYPDSTAPYYLGEMMTEWIMPSIEREVRLW